MCIRDSACRVHRFLASLSKDKAFLGMKEAIMEIKKVGVLGCGLMGSGIAQVCATAGFDVTVLEVEQKFLDKGFAGIEKSLAKFAERPVEKGGITAQQKDAIRARLKGCLLYTSRCV